MPVRVVETGALEMRFLLFVILGRRQVDRTRPMGTTEMAEQQDTRRDRAPTPEADHPSNAGGAGSSGEEKFDRTKTPGEGILKGSTPGGLSADELRRRAETTDGDVEPGTG